MEINEEDFDLQIILLDNNTRRKEQFFRTFQQNHENHFSFFLREKDIEIT